MADPSIAVDVCGVCYAARHDCSIYVIEVQRVLQGACHVQPELLQLCRTRHAAVTVTINLRKVEAKIVLIVVFVVVFIYKSGLVWLRYEVVEAKIVLVYRSGLVGLRFEVVVEAKIVLVVFVVVFICRSGLVWLKFEVVEAKFVLVVFVVVVFTYKAVLVGLRFKVVNWLRLRL